MDDLMPLAPCGRHPPTPLAIQVTAGGQALCVQCVVDERDAAIADARRVREEAARYFSEAQHSAVDAQSERYALARLRPGHTHACNDRFVASPGVWCSCHVGGEREGLAAIARACGERDALRAAAAAYLAAVGDPAAPLARVVAAQAALRAALAGEREGGDRG